MNEEEIKRAWNKEIERLGERADQLQDRETALELRRKFIEMVNARFPKPISEDDYLQMINAITAVLDLVLMDWARKRKVPMEVLYGLSLDMVEATLHAQRDLAQRH